MNTVFKSSFKTWFTGFIAILPLLLTVVVISWVAEFVQRFIGPQTAVGLLLVSFGLPFGFTGIAAWLLGVGVVVAAIYFLGLVIQSGMQARLQRMMDATLRRVPLVGAVYDMSNRFVGVFGKRDQQTDVKRMSPVWCFFGGEGGIAVLALMPNPDPIILGGHKYHIILVPSAPIPIGGGLLYVPASWIKLADFGVETLTSIYVSMGVSLPSSLSKAPPPLSQKIRIEQPPKPESST
jgi:uncharacterized membrane protein